MVREGRILSEAAVCSYPRGTKGERWPGRQESLLKGGTGQELTSAGLFGVNVLNRHTQDNLLVCHGPHIVLSSVLDPCVRDSVVENE